MKNKLRLLTSLALIVLSSMIFGHLAVQLGFADNAHSVALKFSAVLFTLGLIKGLAGLSSTKGLAFADGFVISDTTYAGEAASQFIVKAITGADTIAGGHCYVKDGIKKKFTIPRWDANYEDLIQDRAATPTTKGEMAVDGKVLEPQDYMIYQLFNPRDFEDHWFATQQNETLIDRALPFSAESVVVQEVLKRHSKYLNKALWNSDNTLASPSIYRYYNGWIANALLDADVIDVGTYAALTKSNIVAKFKAGYDAIPDALRYDPSMKIFCNYSTFGMYDEAQKDQTYKGVDFTQIARDEFYGKKVVKIADMPDNCFVIAKGNATMESNMWVGMNSVQDAQIQMQKWRPESELWFFKMLAKVDVNFGWGSEVVLYHPNM